RQVACCSLSETGRAQCPSKIRKLTTVRAVLEKKISCSPYPFLQLGQRVRIRGGALDGIEGVLVGRDSASKLVISIELIQRSLAVSVYNFDVELVGSYARTDEPHSKADWGLGVNASRPWPLTA